VNKTELQAALDEAEITYGEEDTNAVLQELLDTAPAKSGPVVPLKPGDVKLVASMHQHWACYVPPDYTQAEIENPRLYGFLATKFQDLDLIMITAEDGSFMANARIRRIMGREIQVQVYDWIDLQPSMISPEIEVNGYLIRHGGAVKKFYITNKLTGALLREGLGSQIVAMQYLQDHFKAA
jgi:hypothetical protein